MDIVERLRQGITMYSACLENADKHMNLLADSADEITRLRSLLQNGSPVVEGTIQHMAMEIAALKKERDEWQNKAGAFEESMLMFEKDFEACRKELIAEQETRLSFEMRLGEAQDQLAACQKDAERYRWLHANNYGGVAAQMLETYEQAELDDAIDAAIRGMK